MNTKENYLKAMGIDVWQLKNKPTVAADISDNADISDDVLDWDDLQKKVANCSLCDLCKTRTNSVFGVGNTQAEIMFIGEAPGEKEDLQGEPFVGRAGMLLNEMMRSIGLLRENAYIANILKCRPPKNRDPLPNEISLCTPYLKEQIALINPKVIIAVGRVAAHHLLNTDESMSKLRSNVYHYGDLNTPLFVIYHPAYLLRSPREKSKAYIDLKRIKAFWGEKNKN
jgi:uracil-DNA glycosylase